MTNDGARSMDCSHCRQAERVIIKDFKTEMEPEYEDINVRKVTKTFFFLFEI